MSDADIESLLQRTPVEEPSPDRREELRSRVLDEFDKSRRADASFALRLWKKGKRIMVHPITRTAALAAAVVLSLWAFSPTPARAAFADLVKPLLQAKSATYKIVATIEGHPAVTFKGCFLAPNRTRQETSDLITITDLDRGKMMSLTPSARQAIVFDMVKAPAGEQGANYFGDLRKMLEGLRDQKSIAVRELAEKEIAGRRSFGFSYVQAATTMELWADAETKRIVRIESSAAGSPPSKIVMTDFEFDVPLDEKLFSLEPPEGYKIVKANLKPGLPTETEFTETMKKFAEMTGGELPSGFDGASMGMSFARALEKETKDKKVVGDDLMQSAMELGRGLTFANIQPAEADAHYAGRGVKIGGDPKPIYWYKPKGEGKYRVLSTDWKWTEADAAPDVKDAVKLGGFPKSAMKKNGK